MVNVSRRHFFKEAVTSALAADDKTSSMYAVILKNRFGVNGIERSNTMLNLNFINTTATGITTEENLLEQYSVTNYPNTCSEYITILSDHNGGLMQLHLHNAKGQLIEVINEATYPIEKVETQVNTSHLLSGIYDYQIRHGNAQVMKSFMVSH